MAILDNLKSKRMTTLEELDAEGWKYAGDNCGGALIFKRGAERLLYDNIKSTVDFWYIFKELRV